MATVVAPDTNVASIVFHIPIQYAVTSARANTSLAALTKAARDAAKEIGAINPNSPANFGLYLTNPPKKNQDFTDPALSLTESAAATALALTGGFKTPTLNLLVRMPVSKAGYTAKEHSALQAKVSSLVSRIRAKRQLGITKALASTLQAQVVNKNGTFKSDTSKRKRPLLPAA